MALDNATMNDMMKKWERKELWSRRGDDFLVQVSRHSVNLNPDFSEGPHRWCVYAYIYPNHRLFSKFSGQDMWQDAATSLPLHAGPSLLRWHYDDYGKPTSVQVGADYNRLGDDGYTHCAEAEDAYSVFRDADELFLYLSNFPLTNQP